jgi:hypothetical protein
MCRFRVLSCSIFMGRYFCPALSHTDVRLGKILMAVVPMIGKLAVQLFSSYMPSYKYVLLYRTQHKNGMSLFLTPFSSAVYSEMYGWTKTCTH